MCALAFKSGGIPLEIVFPQTAIIYAHSSNGSDKLSQIENSTRKILLYDAADLIC